MKNGLIIGGSSGLGLSLAGKLQKDYNIHITGRENPHTQGITFYKLDLSDEQGMTSQIDALIASLPPIDLLVYAPGFYQEGRITDLSRTQIQTMLNVCLVGAIYTVRNLLLAQQDLSTFVAITSSSQYTPRLLEPVYTAAKAGLGAIANSLALDARIAKTLVAAPPECILNSTPAETWI